VTFQGVTPYLYYADAGAALDWLHRVFGFGPDQRMAEDGVVQEADIAVGPARVMMSGRAAREGEGAGTLLIVHVDDVDALHERVTDAGVEATPLRDEDYGPRTFNVTDPWGYRWYFWQNDAVY